MSLKITQTVRVESNPTTVKLKLAGLRGVIVGKVARKDIYRLRDTRGELRYVGGGHLEAI